MVSSTKIFGLRVLTLMTLSRPEMVLDFCLVLVVFVLVDVVFLLSTIVLSD